MINIQFTKKETAVIMAAFKSKSYQEFSHDPCYGVLAGRKMFPVHDESIQEKLCNFFGLNTSDNTHKNGSFVFWFDWSVQLWRVGA